MYICKMKCNAYNSATFFTVFFYKYRYLGINFKECVIPVKRKYCRNCYQSKNYENCSGISTLLSSSIVGFYSTNVYYRENVRKCLIMVRLDEGIYKLLLVAIIGVVKVQSCTYDYSGVGFPTCGKNYVKISQCKTVQFVNILTAQVFLLTRNRVESVKKYGIYLNLQSTLAISTMRSLELFSRSLQYLRSASQ